MYSPETQQKLALFRAKQAQGTLTDEELQEATNLLRQERKSALDAGAKKRAAKPTTKNGDDLLAELDKLP